MRLLLIEDDPLLASSLAELLREEGFAVDVNHRGDHGLEQARSGVYDALLLDVMLPGLDGWEVLARLRPAVKTPVLMLTARDAVHDRVRGLDLGADDYLPKPFDSEELLARLRALIRRSAGLASSQVELGDFTLDLGARQILHDGVPVPLTAREYSLLEYLALRRGQVVSRTELYDHLFGDDEDSLSNLLDVHVSNLRKKLGAEVISTRRGQGYLLP